MPVASPGLKIGRRRRMMVGRVSLTVGRIVPQMSSARIGGVVLSGSALYALGYVGPCLPTGPQWGRAICTQ